MVEFLVTVPKSPLYMIFPHLKATLSSTLQTWCVSQSSPAKIWSCWVTAFAFTRPSWRSVTYLSHFSHSLRFLRTTCLLRQTLRNPFSCSPPLPFLGGLFCRKSNSCVACFFFSTSTSYTWCFKMLLDTLRFGYGPRNILRQKSFHENGLLATVKQSKLSDIDDTFCLVTPPTLPNHEATTYF